jgi:predicted esterase YcpF (UPF0227 family)
MHALAQDVSRAVGEEGDRHRAVVGLGLAGFVPDGVGAFYHLAV